MCIGNKLEMYSLYVVSCICINIWIGTFNKNSVLHRKLPTPTFTAESLTWHLPAMAGHIPAMTGHILTMARHLSAMAGHLQPWLDTYWPWLDRPWLDTYWPWLDTGHLPALGALETCLVVGVAQCSDHLALHKLTTGVTLGAKQSLVVRGAVVHVILAVEATGG